MGALKVLHLASFDGNIGDNANHSGFRPWLERLAGVPIAWTDLEIRAFFWKERRFDEAFAEYANGFDLVVIGGGNYFELWVERSATGTSIDIAPAVFDLIKAPIFFNALGVDAGQGATPETLGRFTAFLEKLTSSQRYLVTVRNDGAMATLRKHVPAALAAKVSAIPDGGFFLDHGEAAAPFLKPSDKRIGIQIASDMGEIRFREFGAAGQAAFCDEFAAMLGTLADGDPGIQFLFFPHIFRDLQIISDVISRMGDRLRRTRTAVAPYVNGAEGAKYQFGLYKHCRLLLGMRFHANVCALGMGVPVIGLCNYSQIDLLYEDVGHPSGGESVRAPGFSAGLAARVRHALDTRGPTAERDRIMQRVTAGREAFEPALSAWLSRHGLSRKP